MNSEVVIMAVGDLIVDVPDPQQYFAPAAPRLAQADVVIGQIEVPHTTATDVSTTDIPAPGADPAHLATVAEAGFTVVTLAGNHAFDLGEQGILDTISHSRRAGMITTGTGATLAEARTPAISHVGSTRVGVLSYNCVGPRDSWATSKKAGAASVKVLTHYETAGANPGGPPDIYTFADRASLAAMAADITALAADVDIVVVALHKGLVHAPTALAAYESVVARAAIDAGATMVVGHHAHVMRGVEFYRGRAIFHGLGNFVTLTRALSGDGAGSEERAEWAQARRARLGLVTDPLMVETYPFSAESRNTAIAVLRRSAAGVDSVAVIPCWIDDTGAPVPLTRSPEGERVATYIETLSRDEGFDTRFEWDGDEVRLTPIDEVTE